MPERPHYLGHRKRLRERFRAAAGAGMPDYEVLELLLTYAVPRKDVKPAAKRLVARFGGLPAVLDAEFAELESCGLGPASSVLVKLVKQALTLTLDQKMRERDVVSSPRAVADFARARLAGLARENFMAIFLNSKNEVLAHEILQEGTIDRAVVHPRRLIESALARRAAGLVLVHNHPSGHCRPSDEDKAITLDLARTAAALDIRVLDHIIVGQGGHYSFAENGLLA